MPPCARVLSLLSPSIHHESIVTTYLVNSHASPSMWIIIVIMLAPNAAWAHYAGSNLPVNRGSAAKQA